MSGCFVTPTPHNCGFFKRTDIFDELAKVPVTRECFFYEDMGKDLNTEHGERWRVYFYYASHLALTKFFPSERQKESFLERLGRVPNPCDATP